MSENYLKQFSKKNAQKVDFLPGRMGELFEAAAAKKEDTALINKFNEFYDKWKDTAEYKKSYAINFETMPWIHN